ncbi:hypothetical protein [Cellulomonas sp. PhB143]|uniref:hypothetical protein n=1 Tax=Cellulomonas sp. PhB143 TaxID=2485186 RepID=UPI000F49BB03|nr:hypothetical protein [Cellulomonas sp. PhB143]ROS74358.1 hypothetical protein EDF32_2099 [Cellulomonas sp. PhB143]
MDQWIDLEALGKVAVASLLFGAGLPLLFALGIRALAGRPVPAAGGARPGDGGQDDAPWHRTPAHLAAAVVCFALVAVAVTGGIWLIVAG